MSSQKIKVCGMRDAANISEVSSLGVDYIGLDFRRESPRYVTMIPTCAGTLPDKAPKNYMPTPCQPYSLVGVFSDEMAQNIITRTVMFGLDVIQMNGSEPPTLLRNLKATIVPDLRQDVSFWKGIDVFSASDVSRYKAYEDCADVFVLYVHGTSSPWEVLQAYDGERPFLVGGDIHPSDAALLRQFRHERCTGYDLDAFFETQPGIKDAEQLRRFITAL